MAFQNNDDNMVSIFFRHVAVLKLAPDTDCMDEMSPFSLTLLTKTPSKTDGNFSDRPEGRVCVCVCLIKCMNAHVQR